MSSDNLRPAATADPSLAAFVRDAFETDLSSRVDDALDRRLAVVLAPQPSWAAAGLR
jgi:hypothetical protein